MPLIKNIDKADFIKSRIGFQSKLLNYIYYVLRIIVLKNSFILNINQMKYKL